jgi:hypothetical protein
MHIAHHPQHAQHAQHNQAFTAGSLGGSFHNEPSSYTEEVSFRDPGMIVGVEGVDKRRKRRESHNAVERRRRDNINDKIQELNALLPTDNATPASSKTNKGIILKRTVDYVRTVNSGIHRMDDRIRELERMVSMFCNERGILNVV